jgi:hypothetical protein
LDAFLPATSNLTRLQRCFFAEHNPNQTEPQKAHPVSRRKRTSRIGICALFCSHCLSLGSEFPPDILCSATPLNSGISQCQMKGF